MLMQIELFDFAKGMGYNLKAFKAEYMRKVQINIDRQKEGY
jgi:hypothetical protein